MENNSLPLRKRMFLAVFSGILFILSFPPLPFGFLSPLALSIIFYLSISAKNKKEAFLFPFISGLVTAAGLLYWIPRLMTGGFYLVLLIGMVLLFAYMAMWVGLVSLITYQLYKIKKILAFISFPIVWVAQEKLREIGEISFPWITVGYSFGKYNTLIQMLSLFGVYFYSFLIATTALFIYIIVKNYKNKKLAFKFITIIILIYLSIYTYGVVKLKKFDNLEKTTERVAIIQPNIDPLIKWERFRADSIFALHMNMTRGVTSQNPKPSLVVWPESALPVYFSREPEYNQLISEMVDTMGGALLFGSLDVFFVTPTVEGGRYYNSVFYKQKGADYNRYDKIDLLPFAERLPFEGLFPIISRVNLGQADFTPGDSSKIFINKMVKYFAPICYEVVYQNSIRKFVNNGGNFMVQVTNDGWFGRSAMPFQHLNIALYRTIECCVPLARCANTGVSASADGCGRLINSTPIYENKILTSDIKTAHYKTLFCKLGDIVGLYSLRITLLLSLFLIGRKFLIKKEN